MKIALGMDIHDEKCVPFAVYAGMGKPKKEQQEFLDGFNTEFRRVRTEQQSLLGMISRLEGHEVHVLIENSTIAHKVYRILSDAGVNVLVAQSADLDRIIKSVKKNDDNDARELAAYMRRRLHGEHEFSVCYMPTPEWMMKKELIRAVYIDKTHLSNTKKRVRARIKILAVGLKDYKDVSCPASLTQLRRTKDPFLCYQVQVMRDAKHRIDEAVKTVTVLFEKDPNYKLLLSIPGVGVPLAAYLSTIIVDIDRFETSNKLEAYFGLVPKQHSSADSDPDCRTTHRGDRYAREFLGYAVLAHVQHAPESVVTVKWRRMKARGIKHKKIVIACSRKLLDVVWSVLKHNRPFTTDAELLRAARGSAAVFEDEAEDDEDDGFQSMEVSLGFA